jgi:hypothetical protein
MCAMLNIDFSVVPLLLLLVVVVVVVVVLNHHSILYLILYFTYAIHRIISNLIPFLTSLNNSSFSWTSHIPLPSTAVHAAMCHSLLLQNPSS